jgi:putative two-component system response regulator
MKQILVIDDNTASLKQISSLLTGSYNYALTKSGAEALAYCQIEKPSLVLLDAKMPEMDGFETMQRLKAIEGMASVPIIFLTGSLNSETEIRALASGAVDYITKPADKNILMHRMRLHLELYEYQTNLENITAELKNGIVSSFADLVECKDSNTGCHVLRVSKVVKLIGRELLRLGAFPGELTAESLELMAQGAPFHDIGKIGVSDTLLQKPGPLDPDEYAIVKNHTVIGARVLRNIYERSPDQLYMKYACMMAEGHHERFDGAGYPHGLSGGQIPACCRLLTVANVFDACQLERVYKPALSHEEAVEVILEGRGSAFDPLVADAFASIADGFKPLYVGSK